MIDVLLSTIILTASWRTYWIEANNSATKDQRRGERNLSGKVPYLFKEKPGSLDPGPLYPLGTSELAWEQGWAVAAVLYSVLLL